MLFNSIHFLIFFPIAVLLYFSIRHRHRWILLLIASYYFYMTWNAKYIILLIISTLTTYLCALGIEKYNKEGIKKFFLWLCIILNLSLLFTFKYFNFFSKSIEKFFELFSVQFSSPALNVLLPIGISFYTFQKLSYIADVYREKIRAETHLGIFAVYGSFFPQLVAGPIERAENLLHQFYEKHSFDFKRIFDGLKLMLWGFFKKVVIADRLAIVVAQVYNNVDNYTGLPLILATVFFAFQIYCDFSGYSDIAIGAAQVMGFKLTDNFKRPYFSRSIAEFWRRWHISLSSWFRDYLYIPIGGNRVTIPRWYLNIFIVFLVSGLWHGASWTFVAWGGLHGAYLIFSLMTKTIREKFSNAVGLNKIPKIHMIIQTIVTFILVNAAWIFFRANSLSDAVYVLTHLFSGLSFDISGISLGGIGYDGLFIALASIVLMELVHFSQEHGGMRRFLSERPAWFRWGAAFIIIFAILLFGIFESKQFIYFQF